MVNAEKLKQRVLLVIFLTGIYAPLIGSFFRWGVTSDQVILNSELRPAAQLPTLNSLLNHRKPLTYLKALERYYNDHFGFRQPMIQAHSIAKALWLRESSSPYVLFGKQGWLFLKELGDEKELDYYRGLTAFTPAELAEWKSILEQRQAWLNQRGIRYLLVIAPNKTTIYPEFLPDAVNQVRSESRLDQLLNYMEKTSSVKILDLREPLHLAKTKELVYHRQDTHWNDLGAFVAYQQIVNQLQVWFPNLKPLARSTFNLESRPGNSDLINMIGLTDIIQDQRLALVPQTERLAKSARTGVEKPDSPPERQPTATEIPATQLPKAVMLHDSFGESLKPFLSENFSRIVYLWQDEFDPKAIEAEQPDIVIQELVERKLLTKPPH